MDHRQRFHAIMNYEKFDRMPVYYFGQWPETLERWLKEGLPSEAAIPEFTGMDPEWESGIWNCHGLIGQYVITDSHEEVIEEHDTYQIVRTPLGAIHRVSKFTGSIPQHITEAIEPARESWEQFKKYIDPADPRRWWDGWQQKAVDLNQQQRLLAVSGASLFGSIREWVGVENLLMLPYTDPGLFEEMIDYMTEFYMRVYGPVCDLIKFDFIYIFEDCCFRSGPLFSPDMYQRFYQKYYQKLTDFYHGKGIAKILIDSDGKVDTMIPYWLDSGIDIIFPIEIGVWQADPVELRRRFGKRLCMMGGVDKHIIPRGEQEIRTHLTRLLPLVEEGGFIPLPDHRIPPDTSINEFKTYIKIFKEIFCRQ